ncbi:MAG: (2Fe-2S)-binding protein [Alphaproteobacteria bacterium]|nr:(2Fe-2S)-binding protein [Alphaproteobacteria bacterium]MBL7098531.1 (2Fe-2S)-binding protein [Alphaproteobacteria bacterium]
MIVCVCNRLNDTKIRGAIAQGANSADEVYSYCNVRKNCGRCQETIGKMLDAGAARSRLLVAAE